MLSQHLCPFHHSTSGKVLHALVTSTYRQCWKYTLSACGISLQHLMLGLLRQSGSYLVNWLACRRAWCFLTMCPYLLKTGSGIQRELRLAEPPLFRNACCERYRILSWLLTELWKDLGSPTLAYVELGVAAGSTALFLLEQLPWLHAYLVENQPQKELLDALPAFSGRADLLKMDSKEAAQEFLSAQIHVDAIFLDADHSFHGVTADLEDFGQLSPALVMGHDFSWEHPGVVQAALQHSRISGCPLTLAPDHVFFWDWRVQSFNSSTCFGTSKKLKGLQLDGSGEKAVEEDNGNHQRM